MPVEAAAGALGAWAIPAAGSTLALSDATSAVSAPASAQPVSGLWWAASSFWNQPIPASPRLDANSQNWVNALLGNGNVQSIYVNSDYWTVNVYHASSSTPTATIAIANTGKHITIPYQPGWNGTPDSDSHLAIIDDSSGCEYEFQAFDSNSKTAHAIEINNIQTGSGAHIADAGVGGGELSLLGGLITPHDIASGTINHALRIATPDNSPTGVLPATDSDGTNPGGIPEGQLVRLDPSLDLNAYNLNAFQKIVAKALQTYGMYLIDTSGRPKIYFEYDGTAHWNGTITPTTLTPIPLNNFHVITPAK